MDEFNIEEQDVPNHLRMSTCLSDNYTNVVEKNKRLAACHNEVNKAMHLVKLEQSVIAKTDNMIRRDTIV